MKFLLSTVYTIEKGGENVNAGILGNNNEERDTNVYICILYNKKW
jgi:hypothetical protein